MTATLTSLMYIHLFVCLYRFLNHMQSEAICILIKSHKAVISWGRWGVGQGGV